MKISLITGGSRGLGRSMCLNLADKGHDVILTYNTQRADAEDVVQHLSNKGRKAVALPLDLAAVHTFDAFVQRVQEVLSTLWQREDFDVLINNAGMGISAPFMDTTEAQFDQLTNVHLKGPFFLTQKLLPCIKNGGRIINVSTALTRFSFQGYSAYAALKGGMEVLTKYLAKELGTRRISVNVIAPGAIETDFAGGFVRDNKQINEHLAAQTALGRVGLPEDIGQAVAALLSDEQGWINGQRIEVSGGMLL